MESINIKVPVRDNSTGQDVLVDCKVPADKVLRYFVNPGGVVNVAVINNNNTPFVFQSVDTIADIDTKIAAL
ncbi:hypothetical protein HOU74_gp01 [Pectobacterium phage Phoria]|uniref:Uncharacterized protein n=2 Tax=Phimunavirus TaxID=2560202 RepID=A0A385IFS9_9CAUD|nr:hypothetical protein HOU11_gp48 [Pectobacterium phage Gaspode]YP_009817266.1 hypothetical protein HOU74_gp01 [Pectobacterium phage Phoria]AXY81705.1 hypothetical protein [Pectobacterium phage Gaspode]AZF94907.1 hypothetical protein [Pectobacterium phage Phoria]